MEQQPAAADRPPSVSEPWSVYRCILCNAGGLDPTDVIDGGGHAVCRACGARYPVVHNILDTLIDPSHAVLHELSGLAVERGLAPEQWAEVKIRREDHVDSLEELLHRSAGDPVQYYQQTTAAFDQALRLVELPQTGRVLEVGAHAPYYFLDRFRHPGVECFVLNILHFYEEPDRFEAWPHKALGDMNCLPYRPETFDLVILSATAHHSESLPQLFAEIARILTPGGQALVINEPVEGLIKRLSGAGEEGRDEHIHEGRYPIWHYTRAARAAGLSMESFFSDFFDRKLRDTDFHDDTRYVWLGRLVSRLWRRDRFRRVARAWLLWPGQATVGLPLNAIVRKPPVTTTDHPDPTK